MNEWLIKERDREEKEREIDLYNEVIFARESVFIKI